MKKNVLEKYLEKWLSDSAARTSRLMIKRHIIKHAKELKDPGKTPAEWAASMYNLVRTFEKIYNVEATVNLRLHKLNKKYLKNPRRYSPPPDGVLPKDVENTFASTKP